MTLILYNMSCEPNKVDKTNFLSTQLNLSGYLRDGTSIVNPEILVEIGNGITPDPPDPPDPPSGDYVVDDSGNYVKYVGQKLTWSTSLTVMNLLSDSDNFPFLKNYAYIPDFNRYYFVTDIVSVRSGLWLFKLKCDVLMSFKDDIYDLECIVARNETTYNLMLSDSKMKFERSVSWTYKSPWVGTQQEGDVSQLTVPGLTSTYCYLLTGILPYNLAGSPSPTKRPRVMYDANSAFILNYSAMEQLFSTFNTPKFAQAFENLFSNNPMDGVYALRAYPIDFGNLFDLSSSDIDNLAIGSYTTEIQGYLVPNKINANYLIWGGKLDFTGEHEWWNYDDTVIIYLPMVGFKEFAAEDIYGYYIRLQYSMNYMDGTATLFIDRNNGSSSTWQTFKTFNCKMGAELPLSQSNAIDQGTQAVLGLISTAVGAATGNAGALLSGLSSVSSNKLQLSRSEGNSGPITLMYRNEQVDLLQPFALIGRKNKIEPDNYLHTYGKPLNETYVLSDLINSGFTQVEDVHMDGFTLATSVEVDEIASKLKSGVIL